MRSIKPGRGPSKMAGFGSLFAAGFGVLWTLLAASSGAPVLFWLFGVLFVVWGVVQAVYNFRNAGQKNRYSAFDITDEREEPDPLNERFGSPADETPQEDYDPNGGDELLPLLRGEDGAGVRLLPELRPEAAGIAPRLQPGACRRSAMAGRRHCRFLLRQNSQTLD